MTSGPEVAPVWQIRSELSARLREYAVNVAKLNGAPPDVADDVAQLTLIALNDAATRNPALLDILSGPSWRAYVATTSRNALSGYQRSEARRQSREDNEARKTVPLHEDRDGLEELEGILLLEDLSVYLNHEEQLFVHLRYFVGLPMREIAEALTTTEARVSHIGRAAIRKLERILVED